MAQKANLVTLRTHFKYLHYFVFQKFLFNLNFYFSSLFIQLFNKHNVTISNLNISIIAKKIFLKFFFFFKTAQYILLRKKIKKRKNFFLPIRKKSILSLVLLQIFYLFRVKISAFVFKNCNLGLSSLRGKKLCVCLYKFYKKEGFSLFPRRYNFFIDTIKVTALFILGLINVAFFLNYLGEIFKILQKRRHSRFIRFLKSLFQKILLLSNNIKGLKLRINGKLRGKARSSTCCLVLGQVPIQSFVKKIGYAKNHVFTVYGAFGFRLWLYYI